MLPSAGLGLLALLRRTRSIGGTLKPFILHCLLFLPRILRRLRHILPLFSGRTETHPKDVLKKKGGQARPLFPRASGVFEGYSAICASRDFNRAGELHLGPDNAEVLHLGPIVGQSQSAPPSPASSLPPSLSDSDRHLHIGSTPFTTYADDIVPRSSTPLTLTHSRITSTQFAGAPRRSRPRFRSPSLSPHSQTFPHSTTLESAAASPVHSRSPSPLLFPEPHLPQSSVPNNSGNTQILDVVISPPPGPVAPEAESIPPSPLSFQGGHLSQFQTPDAEHSTSDPSDPGSLGLVQENARRSSASLRPNTLAPFQNQARLSYPSQVTIEHFPTVDASGNWSDGKKRSIGLIHSEQVSRYVHKGVVPREKSEFTLGPMAVDLPKYSQEKRARGWNPATHPGGAVYFYHTERRILTDVYMYDPELSAEVQAFAVYLERKRMSPLPTNNYDLVLDIINVKNDEIVWAYYYVDHDSNTLFWQESYECGDGLLGEVRGVKEASHVKLRLESLYWVHWSLYPTCPNRPGRTFPDTASKELLGALLSSGIDSLTSLVPTSPYSVAELESMRDFIKGADSLGKDDPHVITSVARLLSFYAHWRFVHYHGKKAPRQYRIRSIYEGSRGKRTMLIRIFSPILFFSPDGYLRELEKVCVDDIISKDLWEECMKKLVSEWTDFVLYSTVMLAANVSFSSIPGVIIVPQNTSSQNAWINPSFAQIISSISLVFSIGGILTGLLLIRRNRNMMTKDPRSAWHYLQGNASPAFGLEPLAIVFSLAYALLMWSVWGFFVSLLIFSFQNTSRKIWIPMGTAVGIVVISMAWCMTKTWDSEEREEEPDWYEDESDSQGDPSAQGDPSTQA